MQHAKLQGVHSLQETFEVILTGSFIHVFSFPPDEAWEAMFAAKYSWTTPSVRYHGVRSLYYKKHGSPLCRYGSGAPILRKPGKKKTKAQKK